MNFAISDVKGDVEIVAGFIKGCEVPREACMSVDISLKLEPGSAAGFSSGVVPNEEPVVDVSTVKKDIFCPLISTCIFML